MAVFRESSRTRRRRKKQARGSRSDRSLGAARVSSKTNRRKVHRAKTTTIAKVMLATEFGKKQGGIQRVGSAIIEKTFSGEEESSRDWNSLLDPFNIMGSPAGGPPVPAGSADDRTKPFTARPGRATIPVAGAAKVQSFLSVSGRHGLSLAAEWWLAQASKGGNDTGTQLVMNFLEEIQFAIYIDNKLISVLDDESFRQFMNNMKRNLQLRTRGLRSD